MIRFRWAGVCVSVANNYENSNSAYDHQVGWQWTVLRVSIILCYTFVARLSVRFGCITVLMWPDIRAAIKHENIFHAKRVDKMWPESLSRQPNTATSKSNALVMFTLFRVICRSVIGPLSIRNLYSKRDKSYVCKNQK